MSDLWWTSHVCEICHSGEARAYVNGYAVCSQECADRARDIEPEIERSEE